MTSGATGASLNSHYFPLSTSSLPSTHSIELLMLGQSQDRCGHAHDMFWQLLLANPTLIYTHMGLGYTSPSQGGRVRGCPDVWSLLLQRVSQPLSITSFHWNFSQEVICKCFAYAGHIWSNHGGEKAVQMLLCCLLDTRRQTSPALVRVPSPSLICFRKIRENWSPGTAGCCCVI